MDVRRMRGIDKPDHRVIDIHRKDQFMNDLRGGGADIGHIGKRCVCAVTVADPDPDQPLAFAHRENRHGNL